MTMKIVVPKKNPYKAPKGFKSNPRHVTLIPLYIEEDKMTASA